MINDGLEIQITYREGELQLTNRKQFTLSEIQNCREKEQLIKYTTALLFHELQEALCG